VKILVVGGGGREHALAWKLAQSPRVARVFVAPGNAGTALDPDCENVPIGAEAIDELLSFARDAGIDLTVVGPEAPLVAGITDRFEAEGLRCFGPTAAAARLEGSKAFSKDFLSRHNIPTAAYRAFSDAVEARRWIGEQGGRLVVKADGLAAGKGVILAGNTEEAQTAAEQMLSGTAFGDAGRRVVVEEFLGGEEASFIALVDGTDVLPLASSQDHKARDDGDRGPNTGGMGAYSPAPAVTPEMHLAIMEQVMVPTVRGMAEDGTPFRGFLYAGIMIGDDGVPRVLEFNVRLGDPETQPILMRLQSDLTALCEATLDGTLNQQSVDWDPRPCLGVVMAAGGYPGNYEKGKIISGLEADLPDTRVFHAGTALKDEQVVTSGGRVLCVCGLGDSVTDAQARAYQRVAGIHWDDVYYRRDIGYRAVARES
jgi:phosphoribosylamine--glycine ligase